MHPLPKEVKTLCRRLDAPPRLIAHLTLVHDVAARLVEKAQSRFPELSLDAASVRFGAATHDIGKALFRAELVAVGSAHETAGERLLLEHGVDPDLARFARTHAAWREDEALALEDLFVALADNCWKGKRPPELETKTAEKIGAQTGRETWEIFLALDDILQNLAARADERLAYQAQFPV